MEREQSQLEREQSQLEREQNQTEEAEEREGCGMEKKIILFRQKRNKSIKNGPKKESFIQESSSVMVI
jgi:hypothetical protein